MTVSPVVIPRSALTPRTVGANFSRATLRVALLQMCTAGPLLDDLVYAGREPFVNKFFGREILKHLRGSTLTTRMPCDVRAPIPAPPRYSDGN